MYRRDFLIVAGAAVLWPQLGKAQQTERIRRIGYLTGGAAGREDMLAHEQVRSFITGLQERGWIEGRNIRIEYRFSGGELDRIRAGAKELVTLNPDVIVSTGGPTVQSLTELTRTIPVVFTIVADPVGSGLVTTLAHPGGNITGFSIAEPEIAGKWLELLKEVAPQVTRALVIYHADAAPQLLLRDAVATAAPSLGIRLVMAAIHDYAQAETAVEVFAREPGGGLVVFSNIVMGVPPERGPILAARYRLPAVYSYPIYAKSGGLVSYGPDPIAQLRDAAGYVDRILRGEKPGDLPVQQPTRFFLVVNLKAAKELSLAMPQSLLARADEVIE